MVTTPQTIVISGYYGFKNSGDEAVLQSILTALKVQGEEAGIEIQPVVLSIDPEWTSTTYGVQAVHRMKFNEVRQAIKNSSGLISGGGSLLQDVTSSKTILYYLGVIKLAQWMRKPTFIYSQGVGPVSRGFFHPMIKSVFNQCEYVSVRDFQSAELLLTMGLQGKSIQVVPDPVMGLQEVKDQHVLGQVDCYNKEGLPVIGISVRHWEKDHRELVAIADGLRSVTKKQPVHLRFLPFHLPSDVEASKFIMDRLGDLTTDGSTVSICEDTVHPQQMLLEVSRCQLVLGMRLHCLIYAANAQVPMVGISYDPKINHFLKRLDMNPVGATSTLVAEEVSAAIEKLLFHEDAWRETHASQIAQLKQEAQAPAKVIIKYMSSRR